MSNRLAISNLRNALIDMKSDLRGIELSVISIPAAGNLGRAEGNLQAAFGLLTDALTYDVDQSPVEAMGVLCA